MFYQPLCPHCKLAFRFLDELMEEEPRFAGVELERVDELIERERSDSFDYWYVPTFFLGEEKLFEGHMEKRDVRAVLERALESN